VANEFTLNVSLAYDNGISAPETAEIIDFLASQAAAKKVHATQTVATTEVQVNRGAIASVGWFFAINRDETNFVELLSGSAGDAIALLRPGYPCLIYLGDDIQDPYMIANTASCDVEYWLWER
jgi:hypothetical protein